MALDYVTGYLAVTAMQGADQSEVMRALHRLPAVQEVAVITGSMDMLAGARVRNYNHLRLFLLQGVWQIPGVQRTETFLSLAELPSKDFSVNLLESDDMDDVTGPAGRAVLTAIVPSLRLVQVHDLHRVRPKAGVAEQRTVPCLIDIRLDGGDGSAGGQ